VVLILGLILIFIFVMGDLPDTSTLASALSPERLSFRAEGESWLKVINSWSIPFIGSLFSAELVTRMLASRSATVARNGALLGGSIYLLVGLMPATLGLLGPALIPGLEDGEQLLPELAKTHLPTALYVVFIGALVSAILSTVDSALLNAGALVSHNIVVPLLGQSTEKMKVRVARISVVSFGFIAYLLAINADSVYSLVEEAAAFGSAGIFTCCLLGLLQKRGGPVTATASMLVGMISYGVLAYLIEYEYAYLMSLVCAFLTFLVIMNVEAHTHQDTGPVPALDA